jgi:hypothetical protein
MNDVRHAGIGAAMQLGTTPEAIAETEREMGMVFPDILKQLWLVSNGLELPGGWQVFPIFDAANPRKTSNHIKYENAPGRRWDSMDASLVVIARGDTGNCLVLRNKDGIMDETVYHWDHERSTARKWSKSLAYILDTARSRVAKIEKQVAAAQAKREKRG